jgi:hypothetical protein
MSLLQVLGNNVSMLRVSDIVVRVGRAVGGDFMEVEHLPTGIKRHRPPPLGGAEVQRETRARFLREIEAELIAKGLTQYMLRDGEVISTLVEPVA